MSRRVIPAGDSLKDFHRAGGEPGPNRNRAKDSDPGTRLADSYDILLCEGESLPRASLSLGGTSLAPTPHNHIKNS